MTSSVSPSPIPSSNATSQLQARLSQPTLVQQQQQSLQQQTQPQLRYLLERGSNDPPSLPPPVGAVAAPCGIPTVVSSSTGGGGGGIVTTITSQIGAQQQQMNNPLTTTQLTSTPLSTNPLSSTQGVTTSHRVRVPGTTTKKCSTHGSPSATVQIPSKLNLLIIPIAFTMYLLHTQKCPFSQALNYNGLSLAWLQYAVSHLLYSNHLTLHI